ncbi:DinB family protein [candidate division KSB1 bacterium]|nr:DinB family protein [bacterium]NUM68410.1 DinB family protein [candidate division KSB1 bacterium]
MLRTIEDFVKVWEEESGMTLKLFRNLTAASLAQKVTPEGRSLGKLAWHLTTSLHMLSEAGLPVDAPKDDMPIPGKVNDLIAAYEKGTASVRDQVKKHWTDAALRDIVSMYGEEWAKGQVLWATLLHQAHHRGQMTVLMRQAGLKVPGIYGPAREEWAAMNLPPQE